MTILTAIISALGLIISALIAKYDIVQIFKIRKFNLTGTWYGMSVYLPVDIYNVGSECIYEFTSEIKQIGSKIIFKETITKFYDIENNEIEKHLARIIKGQGKVLSDKDIIIQFTEENSLTCGTMYLTIDTWGKELQGIVAVRNPYFGTPAAVKIVLRRAGEKKVTKDYIGLNRIKAMAEAFNS